MKIVINRKMKKYYFILIAITSRVLCQEPKCFQTPFPKILGAPGESLWFDAIDISRATGGIAVGGVTNDVNLIGPNPTGA